MTPLTSARIVLLIGGILLFIYSMQTDQEWARFTAIGLLVVAVLIRLVDRYLASRNTRNADSVDGNEQR